MALTPGQTLGSYRIVEQLGRGGMATVYRAYQPSLDREVAIKVLPESFSEDEVARERFHREAVTVANLNHPNILKLHDFGEEDGVTFLVSELVAGGALSNRLDGPLPPEEVVKYLAPIASALDYAHARGVLHRDLKPSNILLTADGTPVLADFGLALMMSSHTRLTHTGVGVGTPEYMAPEQGKGEEGGKEADLYSLAVIAYEMLTGQVPFSAETPLAVLLAHINKPLPLPRDVNDTLNEAVENVLLKGLAKDPSDRFSTASEFIDALATAAGTSLPSETAGSRPSPWGQLLALRQRRGRVLLAGAGAAIAVALLVPGVASLYFMSGEKENAASDEQESAANTTTSSDQGTVGELTTGDYVNEVEAAWSLFNAKFEALREELSDFSYVTKDRLFETLMQHGAGTFYVDSLAAIEALEPPETYERDHQILVQGLEELVRLDEEAGKAVEERDLVGFMLADRRLAIEELMIGGRLAPFVCKQLVFPIFCRRAGTLPGGLYGEDLERIILELRIRLARDSHRVTNWPSFDQAASSEDVRQFRIAFLQGLSAWFQNTIARLSAMQPPEEFQKDHRVLIEYLTEEARGVGLYVEMWRRGDLQDFFEMDKERDEMQRARYCDIRSQLSDAFKSITRAWFDGLRIASTCDSTP